MSADLPTTQAPPNLAAQRVDREHKAAVAGASFLNRYLDVTQALTGERAFTAESMKEISELKAMIDRMAGRAA
jgi:hypothetical protein